MFQFADNSNPMSFRFMNTRISYLLVVAAALLVSGMQTASAQTWTWVGNTDANTATNSNWNPAGPLNHGLNAIFGAAGSGGTAINWNSNLNVGSITFTSTASAYTMTSGAALQFTSVGVDSIANNSSNLQTFSPEARVFFNGSKGFNANTGNLSLGAVTFRSDAMTSGQTNTLTLTGAASGTIGGTISQSGNFTGVSSAITKTGSGTWTLNGNNTGYNGTTTVSQGTLVLGHTNALGASTVTVNGGVLDLAGRTVTLTSLGGSGGTIALGNGGALTANIINAAVTTYSGAITGTGSFTKDGNGGFILASSNNTYVGDTIISNNWIRNDAVNAFATNGVLRFAASATQLALYMRANQTFAGLDDSAGAANVNPRLVDTQGSINSTLTLNVATGTSYAYSGHVRSASGVLSITKDGAGTQVFSGRAADQVTYTGPTTINAGVLEFSGSSSVANNSAITLNGGSVRFSPSSAPTRTAAITGTGNVLFGSQVVMGGTANTFLGNAVIESAGVLKLGTNSALPSTTRLVFNTPNSTNARFIPEGFSQTVSGIDSSGGSGIMIVEAASVNVSNTPSTLTVAVASGTSFMYAGYLRNAPGSATNSALSITKTGSGSQVFSGDSGLVTYTGPTTINAGVLEFSGAGSVANNSAITLGGGTARFAGGGTRSTAIGGTGGVEKTGENLLTLSGSNTYTGLTTISAGTLAVNGSIASAVNVANAAILSGTGTISGLVTVAGGGILAPGNSPGTQTMTAGLGLADSSILNFELIATDTTIGGGINDLIVVTGNFLLDGVLNVAGTGDFSTVADNTKWRLFNYSGGTFTDGVLTLGTMPSVGASGKYFQIDTATTGQVNLVIVPEPGALALAGLGIAAAAWGLRRRRS
jgi:fibronectin-binding autotransporter adhesin